MNCTGCRDKKCKSAQSCEREQFLSNDILQKYEKSENQKIVQAASALVDNGRAGTLSRLEEIVEFIGNMGYKKSGLAYCYGMENQAILIKKYFSKKEIKLSTVACSVGGIAQNSINKESCIYNVSCNPIGQAEQLNAEGADFVIIMGICLGHDVLLQRNLKADFTTFVVKDRVYNYNPLLAISS
jgi:uncharacterized metal-binding protein